MTMYEISVQGCDDSTTIQIDLDDKEYELVTDLIWLVNHAAQDHCQPTMEIEEEVE